MLQKYVDYTQGQNYKTKVVNWVKVNLRNYLKKNSEDRGEIEHILDFLNSDKAPKRIKYMSYDEAKRGAEKWVKTLKKKGANIIETEEDVEVIKQWKSGMRLVKLVGENAFKREGHLMSHCVGSYVDNTYSDIYSIRDHNNMPHVTMEVPKGATTMQQVKGKGNGSIHPKYIKYVLKSFKKLGIKDIREYEMTYLGYKKMDKDFSTFLYKYFKSDSIKTLTYNNVNYFYKNSKLIRK